MAEPGLHRGFLFGGYHSSIRVATMSHRAIEPQPSLHVFLDNARYHHAKLVQQWLARLGWRIKLHFIPSYCPHLNPIERLWGLMHRNNLRAARRRDARFPARTSSASALLRFGHRQLSRHLAQEFSGHERGIPPVMAKDALAENFRKSATYVKPGAFLSEMFPY